MYAYTVFGVICFPVLCFHSGTDLHSTPAHIPGSPSIENLDEDDWHDLLDVENLLEAYFTIADSTQTTLAGIGASILGVWDFCTCAVSCNDFGGILDCYL